MPRYQYAMRNKTTKQYWNGGFMWEGKGKKRKPVLTFHDRISPTDLAWVNYEIERFFKLNFQYLLEDIEVVRIETIYQEVPTTVDFQKLKSRISEKVLFKKLKTGLI